MVSRLSSLCPSICQSYFCPYFLFPDDNLSKLKYHWIFIKLGLCIDIVKICFRIANVQFLSIFDSYLSTIR